MFMGQCQKHADELLALGMTIYFSVCGDCQETDEAEEQRSESRLSVIHGSCVLTAPPHLLFVTQAFH